ncbi:hypothetical protein [Streptomyces sp. NRRL B-24484]|uniref:hypothetical protein n=1 Tax=Streptomyces sp. NRRL B-24484 TaxID=1463833 RepID=UPI0004BEB494|nr:hypothetical protein [Streptomyces sp. NRRL B-24484]
MVLLSGTGRYRWRTDARIALPAALMRLFPKGSEDCGDHQWYRQDDRTFRCYHCEPGERPGTPEEDRAQRRAPDRDA